MVDNFRHIKLFTIMAIALFIVSGSFPEIQSCRAADTPFHQYKKIVFGCYTSNDDEFEEFATRAKELGATHITITAEDLPLSYWELKPPEDPYPAWVITNPGILKILPPEELQQYIPKEHGEKVMQILEQRCRILRKLGLKAAFHTFEPQMLPEQVFRDHPAWRGPQVDNPMRSRVDRFAPSMSHPGVLDMYRRSIQELIRRCPEIDILQMRTNDSGAGIEWSDALYAGPNGNAAYSSLKMEERISRFLSTLQDAARSVGGDLDVHVYNTKENREDLIATQLDSGMAIDNNEGPDASDFKYEVGSLLYYRRAFAPVPGIPRPVSILEDLEKARNRKARRLFVSIPDRFNWQLYLHLYELFLKNPTRSLASRLELLNQVSENEVDSESGDELVQAWFSLHEVVKLTKLISGGGTVFILGCVHQRWLTRPFVPFPDSLTFDEKNYYRRFQFQARTEEHANDLLDLQGSRLVNGFGGYRVLSRILYQIRSEVRSARRRVQKIAARLSGVAAEKYALLDKRLDVFQCLVNNVEHAAHYQIVLDRVHSIETPPDPNPPYPFLKPADIWSRQELMRIAREEIDNTVALIELLKTENDSRLIDHSETADKEYHRLLGANLINQLTQKINVMRDHWQDYKKIHVN
ncbi:hypothetical protein GF337_14425 [candidate division KSB1 bacterium]|nr:hypothetical protein [candidate division KSB1 bacterium]